jgi:hypothetical protein
MENSTMLKCLCISLKRLSSGLAPIAAFCLFGTSAAQTPSDAVVKDWLAVESPYQLWHQSATLVKQHIALPQKLGEPLFNINRSLTALRSFAPSDQRKILLELLSHGNLHAHPPVYDFDPATLDYIALVKGVKTVSVTPKNLEFLAASRDHKSLALAEGLGNFDLNSGPATPKRPASAKVVALVRAGYFDLPPKR